MNRMRLLKNLGKHWNTAVLIAATMMSASAIADTREGGYGTGSGMMGGYGTGWMGGHGGGWVLILLIAVVSGLVGWLIAKNRK
tara:strand:+ start:889 stop:1137 length:249 start_codon:yes stop_codon:yes gene_type:complete